MLPTGSAAPTCNSEPFAEGLNAAASAPITRSLLHFVRHRSHRYNSGSGSGTHTHVIFTIASNSPPSSRSVMNILNTIHISIAKLHQGTGYFTTILYPSCKAWCRTTSLTLEGQIANLVFLVEEAGFLAEEANRSKGIHQAYTTNYQPIMTDV